MAGYECRKCGERFEVPDVVRHKFGDGHFVHRNICPLCKHSDIVAMFCAFCDHYKTRLFPCGMGHRTIVPFNIACGDWKIRSKDKPEVI